MFWSSAAVSCFEVFAKKEKKMNNLPLKIVANSQVELLTQPKLLANQGRYSSSDIIMFLAAEESL